MASVEDSPEAIVARLAPYSTIFHACLRAAIARAETVFVPPQGERRPHEPWLFAYHVRWELKHLLAESLPVGTGVHVEEHTILSSVVVRLGDIEMRVRKSEPGEVPPAGGSERMQGWYAQTLDGGVSHNILVLWHVDEQRRYTGLDLAFPSGGTAYTTFTKWVVPLVEQAGVADDIDITVPAPAAHGERAAGDASP